MFDTLPQQTGFAPISAPSPVAEPDEESSFTPVAPAPVAPVAAPAYTGPDPVLRRPDLAPFIPPGFTGTRYQLPVENQRALHQYVTDLADQEARDRDFLAQVQQNSKIEDTLKAVTAAKRFIAQRRMGQDYQTALSAGLPHEQALSQALYKNATDLFADHPERMPLAIHRMNPQVPGEASFVAETNGIPAHIVQPTGHWTLPPRKTNAKDEVAKETERFLDRDIISARRRIEKMETDFPNWRTNEQMAKSHDELQAQIDDKQRTVLALKKGGVTVIGSPGSSNSATASPVPAADSTSLEKIPYVNKATGERRMLLNGVWNTWKDGAWQPLPKSQ